MKNLYYMLVYVGGHHEVYCNGENHLRLCGDSCGSAPLKAAPANGVRDGFRIDNFSCDCAKWKEEGENYAGTKI